MKKYITKSNGITMVALVITIIVLIIIASITIYEGTDIIKETNIQKQITNMLTIKSKIKGYNEEIDSKTWNISNTEMDITETTKTKKEKEKENKFNELNIEITTFNETKNIFKNTDYDNGSGKTQYSYVYYNITNVALNNMKLSDLIEKNTNGTEIDNNYIVVFAKDNNGDYVASDIIYVKGIEYENVMYYTLSELQELLNEEE